MEKINHLHYTELRNGRKLIIVSTIEFAPGRYETMVMTRNGREIEYRRTRDIAEAHRDFDELLKKYKELKNNS